MILAANKSFSTSAFLGAGDVLALKQVHEEIIRIGLHFPLRILMDRRSI